MPLSHADQSGVFFRCVEDCSEAIMISDTKGVLVYVNPAWNRVYGFSNEEALGQTSRILSSGLQPKEFYERIWERILDPNIRHWKGELLNKAKDGTLVPVLLTITPVNDSEGNLKGYMGIAVDLTSMKEMEAKVAHQDRLASVGTLASGLAHEIGTPLGVMRGRAEFLMMKSRDPEFRRELEVIMTQADRISKLIRSLLRVSRSFSDAVLIEVSPYEVIQEVLSLLRQNFRDENISVEIDVDPARRLKADFGRLEQVCLNLMMNSIHAIQEAKARGKAGSHALRIRLRVEGGAPTLTFEDTGCGIAPEHMRRLFKPFFTTKDVGQGTGLGLAIVSQLLSEMGARIFARSEAGEGATFVIEFGNSG